MINRTDKEKAMDKAMDEANKRMEQFAKMTIEEIQDLGKKIEEESYPLWIFCSEKSLKFAQEYKEKLIERLEQMNEGQFVKWMGQTSQKEKFMNELMELEKNV